MVLAPLYTASTCDSGCFPRDSLTPNIRVVLLNTRSCPSTFKQHKYLDIVDYPRSCYLPLLESLLFHFKVMASLENKTQSSEHVELGVQPVAAGPKDSELQEHDAKAHRRLRRKIDVRLIPLCAWLYLLNYLDRSNIGNAKILNSETGDSLLQVLHMDSQKYSIAITLFAVAYSAFDIPSNWILKHYVRPSRWLGLLCFGWGALTLGFAFLHTYAGALVLRVFIGMFEAGFYPGKLIHPELQS